MLTSVELPSVLIIPSCDECARDAEENRTRKRAWSKNRSQGTTEYHLFLSISKKQQM